MRDVVHRRLNSGVRANRPTETRLATVGTFRPCHYGAVCDLRRDSVYRAPIVVRIAVSDCTAKAIVVVVFAVHPSFLFPERHCVRVCDGNFCFGTVVLAVSQKS